MAITETVGSLLFGGHRSIMGLFADVVIEENHSDELVITEHPVEKVHLFLTTAIKHRQRSP